jgi:predicted DNA-binding protein
MDSDNEIQLSIRMSAKFRDECKQLSDAAGQTLAEWIRRAMREKLEREVNGESDISDEELDARIEAILTRMLEEKKRGQ